MGDIIFSITYRAVWYCIVKVILVICCGNAVANVRMEVKMNKYTNLKLVTTDQENHQSLRTQSVDIDVPVSDDMQMLIDSMKEYVKNNELDDWSFTVGLAAPQVGYNYNIFVYQIPKQLAVRENIKEVELSVLINATYKPTQNSKEVLMSDGCLSILDKAGESLRHTEIEYTGYLEDGSKVTGVADGLLGHIIQHEIDHTNGVLFIDKVPDAKRLYSIKDIKEKRQKKNGA